ncbi:MAG: M24 family metallopeptidase [Desulfovibrionaceae bacterium]
MISSYHYLQRRNRLRTLLEQNQLDALLILNKENRCYLSGFEMGDLSSFHNAGALLISTTGKDILFTDSRYLDAAKRVWNENDIVLYSSKAKDIAHFIQSNSFGTVGIEEQSISLSFYETIKDIFTIKRTRNLVETLRQIKEPEELALIQLAVDLNHEAFAYIEKELIPGVSEKEISWKLEQFYRNNGAEALSFPSIVAFGKNAALPHYNPEDNDTILKENMPVLIDCGCVLHQYCSDQTRCFWIGDSPSKEYTQTLYLVQNAQKIAIEKLRPGISTKDVYYAAWNYLHEHNVAQYFTHGLGHSIGLVVHENPRLSASDTSLLDMGMVVTIEPGLYYPQWGGIRWEHMAYITEDSYELF